MTSKKGNYERIGLILKRAREARDLTQMDVLRQLGYESYTGRLANIEAGKSATSVEFLEQVGEVLGVDIRVVAAGGTGTHADDVAAMVLDMKVTPSRIRTLKGLLRDWKREDLGLVNGDDFELGDDGEAEAV